MTSSVVSKLPPKGTPEYQRAMELEIESLALAMHMARGGKRKKWSPQSPTPKQKVFLDLTHQEAFYGGAAGGGKSSTLLMAALQYVEVPNYSALLLRRTYADLSKPGALMDRAHEWFRSSGARWNDQKKQWRFPSGAVLAFGYLENENDRYNYQGAEYQFIGFDELTQFSEAGYTYLFSRLRRLANSDVPLRMRSASNPGGIGAGWVQERFIPDGWNPFEARDKDVFEKAGRAFVPARVSDNPHLDREEYEKSLAELSDVERAQLLDGDWQIRQRGNVYPMWSDGYNGQHVITWSQFASVYGQPAIPQHWRGAQGQDWGFDPDPCANVWNWMSAANSPLPNVVYCTRIFTGRRMVADEIAANVKRLEANHSETSRIDFRVLSHEANSEREVYRRVGLMYDKPKPDANGGIAQMHKRLQVRDTDKPHPFKPWLNGCPGYIVVVPDHQIVNPQGDDGLALLREEFAVYKYIDVSPTIHRGSPRSVPYDFFNHYMDAQRMIAARWFPRVTPLTLGEEVNAELPGTWTDTYLDKLNNQDPVMAQRFYDARRATYEEIRKEKLNKRRPQMDYSGDPDMGAGRDGWSE